MKFILKYLILFLTYGSIYFIIESIYKHKLTDWRMFLVGGMCAILIGLINNLFTFDTSFILQCLIGTLIVTLSEAITGYQFNIVEGLHIWDYSTLPLSYVGGQINILFSTFWFFLSGIAIILDDYLRWKFFKEERPHYIL